MRSKILNRYHIEIYSANPVHVLRLLVDDVESPESSTMSRGEIRQSNQFLFTLNELRWYIGLVSVLRMIIWIWQYQIGVDCLTLLKSDDRWSKVKSVISGTSERFQQSILTAFIARLYLQPLHLRGFLYIILVSFMLVSNSIANLKIFVVDGKIPPMSLLTIF